VHIAPLAADRPAALNCAPDADRAPDAPRPLNAALSIARPPPCARTGTAVAPNSSAAAAAGCSAVETGFVVE